MDLRQVFQFDKNYNFMGRVMKAKYEISLKSIGGYMRFIADRPLLSWMSFDEYLEEICKGPKGDDLTGEDS